MPEIVKLLAGKKIYFVSDFHFGIPDYEETRKREAKVCDWLDSIKADAQQLYLLGDLFDSWMEYKRVVPKGYIRFLGKLAELSDAGVEIIIFTGNHDMWMYDYFEKEFKATIYKKPQPFTLGDKAFFLGHGDGLVKEERTYLLMKGIFQNRFIQFLYRQLHPDLGLRIADFFSRLGPKHKYDDLQMKGDDKEYQIIFANNMLKQQHYDYFIFGHRHIACSLQLNANATFINVGDWLSYNTYAVFDGQTTSLKKY